MGCEENTAHGTRPEPDEVPNYTKMDSPKMLAALSDDAYRWAEAFCQIKRAQGWSADDIDHDLMIGWFANAIEVSTSIRQERMIAAAKGATSVPTPDTGSLLRPATKATAPDITTPEGRKKARENADYHRDVLKPFA